MISWKVGKLRLARFPSKLEERSLPFSSLDLSGKSELESIDGFEGGLRKAQKANVDRLSSLPDELLSHILSFLPTKCAVGTSFLSNRWRYLWTSITSLHFEGPLKKSGYINYDEYRRFSNFVDHAISSCSSSHIQKFSLHRVHNYNANGPSWISEAIKRSVSELDIQGWFCPLPLNVFSCGTLKSLTLSGSDRQFDNHVLFNLPCLKVLHVKGLCTPLNGFIETLIRSCPVLEDLILEGYIGSRKGCITVSAPNLKVLQLNIGRRISGRNEISVIAPNLEYLHLSDYFIKYKIKGDFPSVVKAFVNVGDIGHSYHHSAFPRYIPLPKFHKLTCLKVFTLCNRLWVRLPKLIRSSPCLEILSLEQGVDRMSDREYDLVEPESVPKCFGFYLAVVKVKGFKGRKHELQIIKFFLHHAKALQSLSINCQGLTEIEESQFRGQLLKLSRASRSCQIQFYGDITSNI